MYLNIKHPSEVVNYQYYRDAWKTVRDVLTGYLNQIPDSVFGERPEDRSWSPAEICRHLFLTQNKFARAIPLILKGRLGNDTVVERPVNYFEIENSFKIHRKIKNPEGVSPVDPENKADSLDDLNGAMLLYNKNVQDKSLENLQKRTIDHEVFGPLNLVEYTWVLVLHEIHHGIVLQKKYFS